MYLTLKNAHITLAIVSGVFFIIRGMWMLLDSPQQLQRWVKIVPHIVDTGLLGCTVALTMEIHQYPFVDAWLTAKVIVLVLYILAGSIALKRGKTKTIRTMAFSFAVLCYLYLGSIALTHHPLGALLILS